MDLQQEVARFVQTHGLQADVSTRLLDLTSEVGEVAKEVLKGTGYGREPFRPTAEWEGELGDVYFALLCVANSTGVNLEQALTGALAKYESRMAAKGDAGSDR